MAMAQHKTDFGNDDAGRIYGSSCRTCGRGRGRGLLLAFPNFFAIVRPLLPVDTERESPRWSQFGLRNPNNRPGQFLLRRGRAMWRPSGLTHPGNLGSQIFHHRPSFITSSSSQGDHQGRPTVGATASPSPEGSDQCGPILNFPNPQQQTLVGVLAIVLRNSTVKNSASFRSTIQPHPSSLTRCCCSQQKHFHIGLRRDHHLRIFTRDQTPACFATLMEMEKEKEEEDYQLKVGCLAIESPRVLPSDDDGK